MSTFIQIPNRINQLTSKSKLEEIFTYAAIRSQIKDSNLQAAYPQNQLAELVGVHERTIRNYIDTLEKSGLILDTTKKHGYGEYAHNVYQLKYLNKEYFIMNPDLIHEDSISAKLKGLLMLIKSNCIKGTNYLQFNSKQHLSEILHIGKDSLPKYLDDKDIDTNDIGLIAAEFPEPDLLLSTLRERCPQLPPKTSMAYFTKVLRNKRAETKEPIKYEIFL